MIALHVSTKSEAAYERLCRLILEGQLAPGTVIQQEQLAAELGLSTTPLREALRRLEAEHLVSLDAHRRVSIAPLSLQELDEIYFIRMQLDCLAACMAVDRMSDAEITAIRRLSIQRAGRQPIEMLNRNRQFHRALYAGSGNEVLTTILDSLWDRGDRYRIVLMYQPDDIEVAHNDHVEITDAVEAKASKRVEQLMREHLGRSHASIRERLLAG